MRTRTRTNTTAALVAILLATVGCPGDDNGLGDEGTDTTTDTGETGGEEFEFCEDPSSPPAGPFIRGSLTEIIPASTIGQICDDLNVTYDLDETVQLGDESITVLLEYPAQDGSGTWVDGLFPVLVFSHGTSQSELLYNHIWDRIVVERGAVVANIDALDAAVGKERAARLVCVTRWLATTWDEREQHLNCDVALGGHSSGGRALYVADRQLHADEDDAANLFDRKLLLALAPGKVDVDEFLIPEQATPTVIISGSIDNDVSGTPISNYDIVAPEELGIEGAPDKYLIWAYDVEHDSFGGGTTLEGEFYDELTPGEAALKGRTVATEYADAAIQRFFLGEEAALPTLRGESIPTSLSSEQGWWD